MKRDLWLIDGYNVLHSDREYWKFTLQDTGHARERLQEALLDFGGHRHLDIILVFDGKSSGAAEELDLNRHFRVVYTRRGQTADSDIEQQVYRLQDSFRYVYVVTSDGAEQSQISGNGGIRKPSRELMQEMEADKHAQADDRRRSKKAPQGFSVGERIDAESRAILERIRHGRK